MIKELQEKPIKSIFELDETDQDDFKEKRLRKFQKPVKGANGDGLMMALGMSESDE